MSGPPTTRAKWLYQMRQRAALIIKAWLQSAAPNKPKFSDLEDRMVSAFLDCYETGYQMAAAKVPVDLGPEIPGAARPPMPEAP